MRAAEFMRAVASIIDALDGEEAAAEKASMEKAYAIQQQQQQPPIEKGYTGSNQKTSMEKGYMVPPLQQKIELMKKAVGVPSSSAMNIITTSDDEPLDD